MPRTLSWGSDPAGRGPGGTWLVSSPVAPPKPRIQLTEKNREPEVPASGLPAVWPGGVRTRAVPGAAARGQYRLALPEPVPGVPRAHGGGTSGPRGPSRAAAGSAGLWRRRSPRGGCAEGLAPRARGGEVGEGGELACCRPAALAGSQLSSVRKHFKCSRRWVQGRGLRGAWPLCPRGSPAGEAVPGAGTRCLSPVFAPGVWAGLLRLFPCPCLVPPFLCPACAHSQTPRPGLRFPSQASAQCLSVATGTVPPAGDPQGPGEPCPLCVQLWPVALSSCPRLSPLPALSAPADQLSGGVLVGGHQAVGPYGCPFLPPPLAGQTHAGDSSTSVGRERSLGGVEGGTAQPHAPGQATRIRVCALARLLPSPANQHVGGGAPHTVVPNLPRPVLEADGSHGRRR